MIVPWAVNALLYWSRSRIAPVGETRLVRTRAMANAPKREEDADRHQVQDADPLVVHRQQPREDAVGVVQVVDAVLLALRRQLRGGDGLRGVVEFRDADPGGGRGDHFFGPPFCFGAGAGAGWSCVEVVGRPERGRVLLGRDRHVRRRLERLDVGDQVAQLDRVHLVHPEGGHDRLPPVGHVGRRVADRLLDVVAVERHHPPVLDRPHLAEHAPQLRCPGGRALGCGSCCTGASGTASRPSHAGEPSVVTLAGSILKTPRFQSSYWSWARTWTLPTICEWPMPQYWSQKMWYVPSLVGRVPRRDVPAGDHVELGPERRDAEVVDHVLGGAGDLDRWC